MCYCVVYLIFARTVIYLLAGVPLAFLIWYRPLYRGAQNDKAFGFAWFFLASLALLIFTVWSAVGTLAAFFVDRSVTTP